MLFLPVSQDLSPCSQWWQKLKPATRCEKLIKTCYLVWKILARSLLWQPSPWTTVYLSAFLTQGDPTAHKRIWTLHFIPVATHRVLFCLVWILTSEKKKRHSLLPDFDGSLKDLSQHPQPSGLLAPSSVQRWKCLKLTAKSHRFRDPFHIFQASTITLGTLTGTACF